MEDLIIALESLIPHCEYKRIHTQTDKARKSVAADIRAAEEAIAKARGQQHTETV